MTLFEDLASHGLQCWTDSNPWADWNPWIRPGNRYHLIFRLIVCVLCLASYERRKRKAFFQVSQGRKKLHCRGKAYVTLKRSDRPDDQQ